MKPYIPLIGSIDVGTSSTRVILFNKFGNQIAKHQIEYSSQHNSDFQNNINHYHNNKHEKYHLSSEGILLEENDFLEFDKNNDNTSPTLSFPKPGWVQCNPINILSNVLKCLVETTSSISRINSYRLNYNLPPYKIICLGLTNMRETTVVWSNKTGFPLCKYAIVWNDTRNLNFLKKHFSNLNNFDKLNYLKFKTGLPLDSTYFSASKLCWLIENEPLVKNAYETNDLIFGTMDSWLLYNLTKSKRLITDVTNASRTGFMDLNTLQYDKSLFDFWNLDMNRIHLPKITSSSEFFDYLSIPTNSFFNNTLLTNSLKVFLESHGNIPIQGNLGDQHASHTAHLSNIKCTLGTGSFILQKNPSFKTSSNIKDYKPTSTINTISHYFPNLGPPVYAKEGSIPIAGSVIRWLRDNLKLFPKAEDVGPMIKNTISKNSTIIFVPSFSGLWSPYWDLNSRGSIFGLTLDTTGSDIAKAAIEGICYQVRAILEDIEKEKKEIIKKDTDGQSETVESLKEISIDGGMAKSDEVLQVLANILGPNIKVKRSPINECTALGAALAANFAFKDTSERLWKDFDDVKRHIYDPKNITEQKKFECKATEQEREQGWRLWNAAIRRTKGWLEETEINPNNSKL